MNSGIRSIAEPLAGSCSPVWVVKGSLGEILCEHSQFGFRQERPFRSGDENPLFTGCCSDQSGVFDPCGLQVGKDVPGEREFGLIPVHKSIAVVIQSIADLE